MAALEGLIDIQHVAAAGWSFGGEEAMLLAGARFNLDELFAGCQEKDNVFAGCEYQEHVDELVALAGLNTLPQGLWPDWRDPASMPSWRSPLALICWQNGRAGDASAHSADGGIIG